MKVAVPAICLLMTLEGAHAASVECTLLQASTVPFEVTQTMSVRVGTETRKPVETTTHIFRTSPTTLDGFVVSRDGKSYIQSLKMINGLNVEIKAESSVRSCTYTPDVHDLPFGGGFSYSSNCDGTELRVQRDAARTERLEVSGCELDVLVYKSMIEITPGPSDKTPPPDRVVREIYFAPALQVAVMEKSDSISKVGDQENHTYITTYNKGISLNPRKLEMK